MHIRCKGPQFDSEYLWYCVCGYLCCFSSITFLLNSKYVEKCKNVNKLGIILQMQYTGLFSLSLSLQTTKTLKKYNLICDYRSLQICPWIYSINHEMSTSISLLKPIHAHLGSVCILSPKNLDSSSPQRRLGPAIWGPAYIWVKSKMG